MNLHEINYLVVDLKKIIKLSYIFFKLLFLRSMTIFKIVIIIIYILDFRSVYMWLN